MNKIGASFDITGKSKKDIIHEFDEMRKIGLECCQLGVRNAADYSDQFANDLKSAIEETGFEVSMFWVSLSGPAEWNFTEGPITIGLVPEEYREKRIQELKDASVFAEKVGVTDLCTHAGFLPENPTDPQYPILIKALKEVCEFMKERGQNFLFETGQETPVTLLRFIEEIGTGNAFINFDTGNVILYGKANPADAVRVFGKYVRNTHIKDGFYPTNGNDLGTEVKVGEGLANIPLVYSLLRKCNYSGPLCIEREITGEEQKRDIADTVVYLRKIRENQNHIVSD